MKTIVSLCYLFPGASLTGVKPLVLVSEIPDSSKSSFFHGVFCVVDLRMINSSTWPSTAALVFVEGSRPNDLGGLGPRFSLQGEKIESSAGHVGPNPFPQPP